MLNCLKKHWAKFVILIFAIFVVFGGLLYFIEDDYYLYDESYTQENWDYCYSDENVGFVRVHGDIDIDENPEEWVVSSEEAIFELEWYAKNPNIDAIIISIDSLGGTLVASEEIMLALKRTEKPTAAVIRDVGLSGGYLVATGADKIFASRMSDVGGIGITMSYLDESEKNLREGVAYQELTSAEFKDAGSPTRPLTQEEREMFLKDLEDLHEIFVEIIAENRNLSIEAVRVLADGSTFIGDRAKEARLIDEIGGIEDAKNWFGATLGINPSICH